MREKIEGLILSKHPQGERNLVSKVLLRNGKKISVLFFGGQGGGKKQKSSIVEPGYLLEIQLQSKKGHRGELYSTNEWKLSWGHQQVRNNHQAFFLLCFFVEVLNKVSMEDDLLEDFTGDEDTGHFKVLSNALFYLDKCLTEDNFELSTHTAFFLSKLMVELGIAPEMDVQSLPWKTSFFSCVEKAYKEIENAPQIPMEHVQDMFKFVKDQFQLTDKTFRTLFF